MRTERMMKLEVAAKTGAPPVARSPNRFAPFDGYRERAREMRTVDDTVKALGVTAGGSQAEPF